MQVTACNPAGLGDQQTKVYLWVRSCENFQHSYTLPLSSLLDLCHFNCFAKESFSLGQGRLQSSALGQRGRADKGELSRSSLCILSALLHLPAGALGWRCYPELFVSELGTVCWHS